MHLTDVIVRNPGTKTQRTFLLVMWTVLAFFYISLFSQWVTASVRDKMLADYVNHVLKLAANEQRPAREVRALVLIKAEDLLLPVHGDDVQISGNGNTLRATVRYNTAISMPIVNQPVYRMKFDHDVTLKPQD